MTYPTQPHGAQNSTQADERRPHYWYHKTKKSSADHLINGSQPQTGSDGCFWLSSFQDGDVKKGDGGGQEWVVRFTLSRWDESAKHESKPPAHRADMRNGEHWLGIKDTSVLTVDKEWGVQNVNTLNEL